MQEYKEKMMERLNSGESKTIFRKKSGIVIIGPTTSGRKPWQEEEETRKGIIVYLRALQGHSGRSLIDPTLQDNVINAASPSTFLMSDVQSIYIPSSIRD